MVTPYPSSLRELYCIRVVQSPTMAGLVDGLIRSVAHRAHSLAVAHDGTEGAVRFLVATPTIVRAPVLVTEKVRSLWGIRQTLQVISAEVVFVIVSGDQFNLTGLLEVSGVSSRDERFPCSQTLGDLVVVDFTGRGVRAQALSLALAA